MPTYSYFCEIHKEFEVQQSIKDEPLEACPKCIKYGVIKYHCKSCDASWFYPKGEADYSGVPNSMWNPPICVSCNSNDIESLLSKPKKLISLSSFSLKGGGWGSTGYSKN